MQGKRYRNQEFFKKIARERVNTLFFQAKKIFKENSLLSDRYVHLARKIAMKHKIRMPDLFKRRFCKNCYKYLVPSVNSRIRVQKGKIITYCFSCKHYMRMPYRK